MTSFYRFSMRILWTLVWLILLGFFAHLFFYPLHWGWSLIP